MHNRCAVPLMFGVFLGWKQARESLLIGAISSFFSASVQRSCNFRLVNSSCGSILKTWVQLLRAIILQAFGNFRKFVLWVPMPPPGHSISVTLEVLPPNLLGFCLTCQQRCLCIWGGQNSQHQVLTTARCRVALTGGMSLWSAGKAILIALLELRRTRLHCVNILQI